MIVSVIHIGCGRTKEFNRDQGVLNRDLTKFRVESQKMYISRSRHMAMQLIPKPANFKDPKSLSKVSKKVGFISSFI